MRIESKSAIKIRPIDGEDLKHSLQFEKPKTLNQKPLATDEHR